MRVTGKMIRLKLLDNMQSAMQKLQLAQTQMATGKRILKPSDDPLAISKALGLRTLFADDQQYLRNIEDALDWIDNTEPVVDGIVSVITELKEIAIEGASDTKSEHERSILAQQVEGLIDRLVGLANTQYAGKYVFAGTYTLTLPYSLQNSVTGETAVFPDLEWVDMGHAKIVQGAAIVTGPMGEVYVEGVDYEIDHALGRIRRLGGGSMVPGDTYTIAYETETTSSVNLNVPDTAGRIKREVAPGMHEGINTGGQEILASGTDIFALLISVKNSLFRNQGIDVNQALDEIEAALEQVTTVLGSHGIRHNTFELARARLESEMVNLQALVSQLEDADLAEVMVRFETEQMAYESALAAASQIMNTSLVNFIR